MTVEEKYSLWLEKTAGNEELNGELRAIAGDEEAIRDRFYRELAFGTGGLRGVLGAGSNRMNVYTVARATQGVAQCLLRENAQPSVALAYDSRRCSRLFAETAAAVFAANGVRVWIYPHLMPTPALSFAVRALGCDGGAVITASHNPAEYNGYKVYGADGCQITTVLAERMQSAIDALDPFADVRFGDFAELSESGMIRQLDETVTEAYLAAVSRTSVLPQNISRAVSVVYTPLNGAGISCVPRALAENGFTDVYIPPEQAQPDGAFPTCPYPNPEVREALQVGLRTAAERGSELLLATDPDCDRVGIAVKNGGSYTLLTGNETGVLLFDFICRMRLAAGTMPVSPIAVKTIVTTPMAEPIAAHYGVELRNVLTGFKYIGEQLGRLERAGEEARYIFGFEESYGYLTGGYVRDKDAVNASLLICEMFAWYKAQGITLIEALNALYDRYGAYRSRLVNFAFAGESGAADMRRRMKALRDTPPTELAGLPVLSVTDYLSDDTGLPRADVLRYRLPNGREIVVRPSGTEPKLKLYLTAAEKSAEESLAALDEMEADFRRRIGA